MLKITPRQLSALSRLGNHPSINNVSFCVHNGGNTHINVASKINANLNDIELTLHEIFPFMKREEKPFKIVRDDGTIGELYDVSIGEGIHFVIHMDSMQKEIAPLSEGAVEELIHSEFITREGVGASV